MNDTIGGKQPTASTLHTCLTTGDYQDRLYAMTDAVNRGLQMFGLNVYLPYDLVPNKGKLTDDGPTVSIPSDKMSYITPIEDKGISLRVSLAIPYYVKYELFGEDNPQLAYGAREEFERLRTAAKMQDIDRQDKVENVFEEVT